MNACCTVLRSRLLGNRFSCAKNELHLYQNFNISAYTKETPYWLPDQNSQLLHPTGNSALVLLTGNATLLPTPFFALHKQDSASGSLKQQFSLNLYSVSVVHFALIAANWRISSISRGFGLLGFCLPRLLDSCTSATSRTFAPLLQVCSNGATSLSHQLVVTVRQVYRTNL